MKKIKKILITFFLILGTLITVALVTKLMLQIFDTKVYADVGSFEDYGGSSWDSRFFLG